MDSVPKEEGVPTSILCGIHPRLPKFLKRKKARAQDPTPNEKGDDQAPVDNVKVLEEKLARVEAEAAEEKRRLEDEVRQGKELLETREKQVGQMDADIQRLNREGDTQRAKLAELRMVEARARDLTTRLTETEKLLNDRTTELSAAQVFLTKVDAVSEAEVVGMVDNLNTLICSASGALSDTWDQREPIPGTLSDESDLEQIQNDFGHLMAQQIAARDSVAVNLAVQMLLGQFIERITSGWGTGPAADNLAEIYGMISTKESQTVASRWRTLTKSYIPSQDLPRSEEIIGGLARILMVTQSFSDFTEAVVSVEKSAGAEINQIIEATVQLDDTIKTKMASSDMTVYIVLPGAPFYEETMEDEFDGPKEGDPPTVAGTMEIGLFQKSGNVEKVLRKPKVILERDLIVTDDVGKE